MDFDESTDILWTKPVHLDDSLFRSTDDLVAALMKVKNTMREQCDMLNKVKEDLIQKRDNLEKEERAFVTAKAEFERQKKFCEDVGLKSKDQLELNVGGKVMNTSKSTLCSIQNTMLYAAFSGGHKLPLDSSGRYFLDRDPKIFRYVLNYLRQSDTEVVQLVSQQSASDSPLSPLFQQIIEEFDFFCIPLPGNTSKMRAFIFDEILSLETLNPANVKWYGNKIVTCGKDGLLLWDFEKKKLLLHQENVRCCDVDGRTIAFGGRNGGVTIIDMNSQSKHECDGHQATVWSVKIIGKHVLSCSTDKTIKLWSEAQSQPLLTFEGHTQEVWGLDAAMGYVVTTSKDRTIRLWNLNDGSLISTLIGHTRAVYTARILPKTRQIVSASWDKTIKIWEISSGNCVHTLDCDKPVTCFDISGHILVSGSESGGIRVWNLNTQQVLYQHQAHKERVTSVAINGNKVVTAAFKENVVRVWRAWK